MGDRDAAGAELRDEAPASPSDGGPTAASEAVAETTEVGSPRWRVAAWLVALAAFALFFGFGSVTLEAGARPGRSLRVAEVWRRFVADPPEVGHATLLRVVVFGAIVAVLLGFVLGLWLAVNATDDPAGRRPTGNADGP